MDNDSLRERLTGYGTPEQIDNTIARIHSKTSWKDYMENDSYDGALISPYSIKDIIENYYNSNNATSQQSTQPPSQQSTQPSTMGNGSSARENPENDYELIREERRHTGPFSPFHETHALETWYIYRDKNTGNTIETKTRYHGGKRKSRRNQKSKKSNKKSSKKSSKKSRKKLRKSNRRR